MLENADKPKVGNKNHPDPPPAPAALGVFCILFQGSDKALASTAFQNGGSKMGSHLPSCLERCVSCSQLPSATRRCRRRGNSACLPLCFRSPGSGPRGCFPPGHTHGHMHVTVMHANRWTHIQWSCSHVYTDRHACTHLFTPACVHARLHTHTYKYAHRSIPQYAHRSIPHLPAGAVSYPGLPLVGASGISSPA